MKKTKKLFFIALAVMLISMLFCFSASALEETGSCGPNATWKFNSETGELVISGTGEVSYEFRNNSDVVNNLRFVIIEDGITSIGDYVFSDCYKLSSITIPDSVMSFGYETFYMSANLKKVYISNLEAWCNVSFSDGMIPSYSNPLGFGADLYLNGELLTDLIIPEGVESIGCRAFERCESLKSVTIGNSVKTIGDYAFVWCDNIESVTILDGITSIGKNAFYSCRGLKTVKIPGSVTSIGYYAFNKCEQLERVYISDIKSWLDIDCTGTSPGTDLYLNGEPLIDLIIPEGIESIRSYAFNGCDSLESVTIPDGVKSIDYGAFSSCDNLKSVTLPNSLTSIDQSAFSYCDNLKSITIPESVNFIDPYAFYESVESITILNPECFLGDSIVGSDYSWDTVVTICGYKNSTAETYAINNGHIFKVYCPHENTTDYEYVAPTCTTDGHNAGRYCNDCEEWASGGEVIYASHTDENTDKICDVCGEEIKQVVETGSCGYNVTYTLYDDGLLIISGTGSINSYAFEGRSEIKNVKIMQGITSINSYAFNLCSNLASVTIPDTVTSIGSYAFYSCSNLVSVTIPASVTGIGSSAFYDVNSITILNPNCDLSYSFVRSYNTSVTIYGYKNSTAEAYANSNGNTFKVYCPHNNTTDYEKVEATCTTDGREAGTYCSDCEEWLTGGEVIYATHTDENSDKICDVCGEEAIFVIERGQRGENVFYKLYDNGLLVISGTGDIPYWSFSDRIDIKSVIINPGITGIGETVFYDCPSLTSVTIGNSVESIGQYAFGDCTSLISVTIPDSVTSIGSVAFSNCLKLKTITLGEGLTSIGGGAFGTCIKLEEIIIPESVENIGDGAFNNCIRLSKITVENPNCTITQSINTFPENATLYGYEGSTLQTYADDWNRKFVVIGSEEGGEEGGEETPDTPDAPHTHKFEETWTVIGEASCSQYGISIRFCEGCNAFETKTIAAYGHADNDGDKKCDECGVVLEVSEPSEPSEPTEPEAPEEKEEANVFSFLTEFLNKLMDFLKSLFKID